MNNIFFTAKVEKGIGLGSKIGFPTINLNFDSISNKIDHGVYSCEVKIDEHIYKGVMHFGPKSIGTDNENKIYCEIHLINTNKSINNKEVKVKVLKNIRDVREFKSADELKEQIIKDIQNV